MNDVVELIFKFISLVATILIAFSVLIFSFIQLARGASPEIYLSLIGTVVGMLLPSPFASMKFKLNFEQPRPHPLDP
jgi:uncharacterized membrane protein